MGWVVFRVVRVPWPNTRTTRNNFGYRGLEPELGFGFFGFGLRVSGILPSAMGDGMSTPVMLAITSRVFDDAGSGADHLQQFNSKMNEVQFHL